MNVSDTVAELGYDHAGPLYHKILGSAESDGAFYTNNISALMLAGWRCARTLWIGPIGTKRPGCASSTLRVAPERC